MLFTVCYSIDKVLYEKQSDMFLEKQIINNDISSAFAGAISDDKKIIALGKMSGKIDIY